MSSADIDSPRLRSERERLFGPGEEGQVRALVLALARPADWEVLGRVWKGVQDELGWPAPGIAVSGTDACQLWFSLADPLPPAQAHALLERLRLRYLAEVPAHRVELIPSADGERQVPRIPAALGEEAWSAYVAPDLAPVFAETPWLDVPPRAEGQAEDRILDALVGPGSQPATRDAFRKKLRAGELDDKEIEIALADTASPLQGLDMPGGGGNVGLLNLSDLLGKMNGGRTKTVKLTVAEAMAPLTTEESDKLLDQESLTKEALLLAENEGIVFLDEIDKVAARQGASGADVSREGVQRDLLPLIEGTTVSTKYGPVKTDHVLFIASGAFHVAKPSDLLPELQGRLPIRVELKALTRDDFKRILTEPEANLIRQNQALLETEGVGLVFTDDAVEAMADAAVAANNTVENIGARRLQTVLERVLEETSFKASDLSGQTLTFDGDMVRDKVGELARNIDLSRFIL